MCSVNFCTTDIDCICLWRCAILLVIALIKAEVFNLFYRGCYFPSGPDGHLAPSYAISRLGPRAAASNCVRRHGGYTAWRGSENSRIGLVGEIISPLRLGRVRVRVMDRVRVKIRLGVGFGLGFL